MGEIRAVAFDLDDTLVDHDRAARAALAQWVAARGWQADETTGDRWIALEKQHFADYVRGRVDFSEHRRRRLRGLLPIVAADVPPHLDDDELDALFGEYRDLYVENWVVFADAVPALRRLAARGLVCAVLTNGQPAQQQDKLDRTGLAGHIDLMLTVGDLPAPKPDPGAFATLCTRLGLTADQVCFVGDDLAIDVHGALSAGLSAVHLDRTGAAARSAGHATVTTLADLPV